MPTVAKRPPKKPAPVYEPPAQYAETVCEPAQSEPQRKPRKTLGEMAAGDGPLGIVCQNCRQAGWTVWYTRPQMGKIVRVRICRYCKFKTTTFEREAGQK